MTDELLHLAARVLLRACLPLTAHEALGRIGRWLPPRRDQAEVRRALTDLGTKGTCLSRCLAISARARSADVVIGVRPTAGAVAAHAWLEVAGVPLDPGHGDWREIARLCALR